MRELIRKLFNFPPDVREEIKPATPWYYSVAAEDYRITIEELKRQLEVTRKAKEAAEMAARRRMMTGDEERKLLYLQGILHNLKKLLEHMDA